MTPTAQPGAWTATPPTEPGDYHWREREGAPVKPCRVYLDSGIWCVVTYREWTGRWCGALSAWGGEWWSVPIQEPPA